MTQAIRFSGNRIRAITFDGGGTVYPKGKEQIRIHQEINDLLVKTAVSGAKLALISVNSSEVDLARVGYPLREALRPHQLAGQLACYVDGGARLVTFDPEEKSDENYSKPFYIPEKAAARIRKAICQILPSQFGLNPEERIAWLDFYRERHPSARLPWLEGKMRRRAPLKYFPELTPTQAKNPPYAPWLENRDNLMLAIKVLPRQPREVRDETIRQIFRIDPALQKTLRFNPGGFGSIDILDKKAGKRAALNHFMNSNHLAAEEVIYVGDELTPDREDSDLLLPDFAQMPKIAVNSLQMPVAENIPNLFYDPLRTGPQGTAAWLSDILIA